MTELVVRLTVTGTSISGRSCSQTGSHKICIGLTSVSGRYCNHTIRYRCTLALPWGGVLNRVVSVRAVRREVAAYTNPLTVCSAPVTPLTSRLADPTPVCTVGKVPVCASVLTIN